MLRNEPEHAAAWLEAAPCSHLRHQPALDRHQTRLFAAVMLIPSVVLLMVFGQVGRALTVSNHNMTMLQKPVLGLKTVLIEKQDRENVSYQIILAIECVNSFNPE